jgi:hypothetical protein
MYEVDEYTMSLLHFEDGIKDECGKKWVSNNAGVSTDQKKFGNSALAVDVGKYIYTDDVSDFDFTGQFTIEMWAMFTKYPNAHSGNFAHDLFSQTKDSNNCINMEVGGSTNSIAGIGFDSTSGGARIVVGEDYNLNLNTWYHVAFVADGLNGLYVFANGKLLHHENISVKFPLLNSTRACIGKLLYTGAEYDCIGYIDEVRISKIARWTSDFTPPGTINAPINLTATPGDSQVTLSWNPATGATGNVKRSTTAGGPYTTIATNVAGTSYIDNTVTNGTTYYYVITAVDSAGNESPNSNEASAAPQVSSGQALLRVTMIDSSEREYQLSTVEIDGFINWYTRTIGTGTTCYVLNKNIGLQNSKEYLAFDKVISFEVIPITK